ncbi:hypothetical protein D3C78_1750340 [compost metagenome]
MIGWEDERRGELAVLVGFEDVRECDTGVSESVFHAVNLQSILRVLFLLVKRRVRRTSVRRIRNGIRRASKYGWC